MRGLALLPVFIAGLLVGVWLVASPWAVAFPPGAHGGWSVSTWSAVWTGAIVAGASGAALVTTVGLALSAALSSEGSAFPPTGPGAPPPPRGWRGSGEAPQE